MSDETSRSRSRHGIGLREATGVWAHIGVNTFGGPAGQIAVMHRELVERRRWVSDQRFFHALNYCMLLPGPEAQQLATYIGWLMNGVPGGVIAGALFVIPGFVAMLALASTYALYGTVTWVAGLLFGISSAVVAIVTQAVIRIGRRTLRGTALRVTAALSFVAIFCFAVPFPFIIAAAGVFGWGAARVRPGWFPLGGHRAAGSDAEPRALLPDDEQIDRATTRRAFRAASFCAALWLIPVVALVAVLGSANMVVEFVGFLAAYNNPGSLSPLLAGTLGAVLTVWVTFVPCFLFIFIGAPYVERLRGNATISHALTAISAAVAGVVLNLAVYFATHTAFATVDDRIYGPLHVPVPVWSSIKVASVVISVVAGIAVFRFKVGTLRVLGGCAVLGVGAALAGWT